MTDIRLIGFVSRAPLTDALAWIDARTTTLASERVALAGAVGRVLTSSVASPVDWPGADCAAMDGYAVHAVETEGASEYNPLPLRARTLIAAGLPMPPGADAILPFASAEAHGLSLDALAPIARGAGVDRRGSYARTGGLAVAAGPLRPQDVALLRVLGAEPVAVVRRPLVALAVAGPKSGPDVLTPMLQALVARDGGVAAAMPLPASGTDLILMAGRTGAGPDDTAVLELVGAGGVLDMHGIAIRPGDSAGLGHVGDVPVLLLPGPPHACLAVYDLLAARAIRRFAGMRADEPYGSMECVLERKAASAVGFTEVIQVSISCTQATPIGPADAGTLAGTVQADGFIVVPETSEGLPAGASVRAYIYRA